MDNLKNKIAYLPKGKYAIAVSGGSDSLALLYLIANDDELNNNNFIVTHFDHQCRDESSTEANFVEQISLNLGFKFEKHIWTSDEKDLTNGNFYQQARIARYSFFKKIIDKNNLNGVLIGHSKTDLAETLLMRLGKGASIKGASIFKQGINVLGVDIYRPLLNFDRKDLQNYLTSINVSWKSDPSNKDENKMRPRIRKLLPTLEEIGISLSGIKASVKYFNQADLALNHYFKQELENFAYNSQLGFYSIDIVKFRNLPLEIKVRVINYMLENLNSKHQGHLPRRKKINELLSRIENDQTCVEIIGSIKLELIDSTLYIFKQNPNFANLNITPIEKNVIPASDLSKSLRYDLLKKYNLQLLPQDIKNIIPFTLHNNSAENNHKINDFSCLISNKTVKIVYTENI